MAKKKRITWWGEPNRFSEREDERKVSWLELFYDLVYVATIAELTHHLSEHISWHELGFSLFIFAFIYWSWANGSLYHDLHGNNAIRTRLFTLFQIIAIAAVAVTLGDLYEENHKSFAMAFTLIQFIITYLWWSTGYYDPSHKQLNKFYVLNYSLSLIIFIFSIFVNYDSAITLWIFALVLNLSTSLVSSNTIKKELSKRGEVFAISSTMVERYGLFAIIALGETVFGITETISDIPEKGGYIWGEFIVGIIISFLLWWIYFGMIGNKKVKIGYKYFVLIDYLNLILLFAIGVVGACVRGLLSPHNTQPESLIKWVFCIALITTLVTINLLSYIREHNNEELSHTSPTRKLALLSSALTLILTFFSTSLSTLSFISIISFILLIPVVAGTLGWIHFKIDEEKNIKK